MAQEITLAEIGETLEFIVERMATKRDIADLRAELKNDIAELEQSMASKDDVRTIVREETRNIRDELADIRHDLMQLAKAVQNIAGLPKEIDHALDRIRRIEKHLGIEAEIAA